jgi:glucose-6-phosphate isomerase
VGLLPALLQGIDIDRLLGGARKMDAATRERDPFQNIAMLLALAWHHATDGAGRKDMVILPYKDRLGLLSRYLQQLIMESLGKEKDAAGRRTVHQGITVYGNKGSTDQHSYVQQLRDGVPNFFATFIEVLRDREGGSIEVEYGVTSGDYLLGFLLGTRQALHEKGRPSITITLEAVTPEALGALIALYERAVGLYASLIGVNAYDQPGVEAGKEAAARVIEVQREAVAHLFRVRKAARKEKREVPLLTAREIAKGIGAPGSAETVFKVLEHLAANGRGVKKAAGSRPDAHRYRV